MPFSFVVEADLKDQKQLVSKLTKEKSRVLKEKEEIDASLQHKKVVKTELNKLTLKKCLGTVFSGC